MTQAQLGLCALALCYVHDNSPVWNWWTPSYMTNRGGIILQWLENFSRTPWWQVSGHCHWNALVLSNPVYGFMHSAILCNHPSLHIECISPTVNFWSGYVGESTHFFKLCLPSELLGNWYSRQSLPTTESTSGYTTPLYCYTRNPVHMVLYSQLHRLTGKVDMYVLLPLLTLD